MVLSGGAAVALNTEDRCLSPDVDLIPRHPVQHGLVAEPRQTLGFVEQGRDFRHPDSAARCEFPPGPPVGDGDLKKNIRSPDLATVVLHRVTPTDSLKDRLGQLGGATGAGPGRPDGGHPRVDPGNVPRSSTLKAKSRGSWRLPPEARRTTPSGPIA